jgi:hypothetical protein
LETKIAKKLTKEKASAQHSLIGIKSYPFVDCVKSSIALHLITCDNALRSTLTPENISICEIP